MISVKLIIIADDALITFCEWKNKYSPRKN